MAFQAIQKVLKLDGVIKWLFYVVLFIVGYRVLRKVLAQFGLGGKPDTTTSWFQVTAGSSYTYQVYNDMANNIRKAVDGFGTDWPVIKAVFEKLMNYADYDSLSIAYGTRQTGWFGFTDSPMGLHEALQDDLSRSELNELQTICRNRGFDIFL